MNRKESQAFAAVALVTLVVVWAWAGWAVGVQAFAVGFISAMAVYFAAVDEVAEAEAARDDALFQLEAYDLAMTGIENSEPGSIEEAEAIIELRRWLA